MTTDDQQLEPDHTGHGCVQDPSTTAAAESSTGARRYDHCDETCTVDCGHCKGRGKPNPMGPVGDVGDLMDQLAMVAVEPVALLATVTAERDRATVDLLVTNGRLAAAVARAEKAEAQVEAVRALTDQQCMDLWWTASADDWAVPDWLPGKFLRAALLPPAPKPEPAAEVARCGEPHPTNETVVGCGLDTGHDGPHFSWTGCEGSDVVWPTHEVACDCDFWHDQHRTHCATNFPAPAAGADTEEGRRG